MHIFGNIPKAVSKIRLDETSIQDWCFKKSSLSVPIHGYAHTLGFKFYKGNNNNLISSDVESHLLLVYGATAVQLE